MTRPGALAVVGALVCAMAGCGPPPVGPQAVPRPRTTVSVTLNSLPYGEHAPFYYGLRTGIYASQGIDLRIRPGTGSATTVRQVAEHQSDFGWADTPALILAVAAGAPVRSVGAFLQKSAASIEFFADRDVSRPADLKGATIGGTPGDALYPMLPAWLAANGLSEHDVTVVDLDPAGTISALAERRVDAVMGFFDDQAPAIENRTGRRVGYLRYADWGLDLLGTGLVATRQTLTDRPDLTRRFVKATQQSWAAAAADVPGAVAAMVALAGPAPSRDVLARQLTLALALLGTGTAPGVDDEARWSATLRLMARYGALREPGIPAAYWDPSFAGRS